MSAKKKQTFDLKTLKVGKFNPRKSKTDISSLAADIKAHGLINPLTVLKDGTIVAGHRRYAALKQIKWQGEIPVTIVSEDVANEIAISENTARENMHPADTFEAFKKLVDSGLSISDVAAKFGYSELYVKQLLALATVSNSVIKAYREEKIDLETAKAFTGGHGFEKQDAILERVIDGDWSLGSPEKIRHALNDGRIHGDDKRIRLIGWKAFEKAGGVVHADLFGGDAFGEGEEILNSLVDKALEKEAKKHTGWKFVEIVPDADYAFLGRYGKIQPTAKPLSDADQKKLDELVNQYEHSEEYNEELDLAIDAIRDKIEYVFSDEDKAKSGVIICLDYNGVIDVRQGMIHPDDVKAAKKALNAELKKSKKSEPTQEEQSESFDEDAQIIPNLISALEEAYEVIRSLENHAEHDSLLAKIERALEGAK